MRPAFLQTLVTLARSNKNIFLLVGDVGYSLMEPFAREFPDRYINVGIAEQNMIGIAAGLALSGKTVFVYSLANFPTVRCLEQIRNDVCYHNASVKIVASGGGLAYGSLGPSHHATEDISIMRSLPNMAVIAPGDPVEASLATRAVAGSVGPCYLRLAKTGEPVVHHTPPVFQIGKAITAHEGRDITLIATGGMLYKAVRAAEQLASQAVQAQVLSMHTIKPLDSKAVLLATGTGGIVTIEEHSVIGGLGSAVAELLAENGNTRTRFKRMGLSDSFCTEVGSQECLTRLYSLSIEGIVSTVMHLLKT